MARRPMNSDHFENDHDVLDYWAIMKENHEGSGVDDLDVQIWI